MKIYQTLKISFLLILLTNLSHPIQSQSLDKQAFYGKWQMDSSSLLAALEKQGGYPLDEQEQLEIRQQAEEVYLDLQADGTFLAQDSEGEKEGTWQLQADTLVIEGDELHHYKVISINAEQLTLNMESEEGMEMEVIWRKKD